MCVCSCVAAAGQPSDEDDDEEGGADGGGGEGGGGGGGESGEEGDAEEYRKTIMIGSAYQAQVPEGMQAYGATPPYENQDKLLWAPHLLTLLEVRERVEGGRVLLCCVLRSGYSFSSLVKTPKVISHR